MDTNSQSVETGAKSVEVTRLFENQLLTYRQVKSYFGISGTVLKAAKSRREISYVLIGTRGVRFRVSAVTAYLESREVKRKTA